MKDTIVYEFEGKIYINLTNSCSNSCEFCIRNQHDGIGDNYLWLSAEPTAAEVISELEKYDISEAIYCGFGEPLYAFEVLIETAKYLKGRGIKTRINTNGQASLIVGENAAKKLAGLIDTVSISLNASTAEGYDKVCHCAFGEKGFYSMLQFVAECKTEGIRVVLSVVDIIGEKEVEACRKIAEGLGAEYKVRTMIE